MPGNPTQTIFNWLALGVCFGNNANFMFCVGGNTNFSVSRYQHEILTLGSRPTQGPNAKILHRSGI